MDVRMKAAPGVNTKGGYFPLSGNDSIGFIRVRKRQLKGGHPSVRSLPSFYGKRAQKSMSFDLVRAIRIDGKPRHEFVLGLGSQKNVEKRDGDFVWFWFRVIRSMKRHGLTSAQRRYLAAEMVRKGARLPTIAQCHECRGVAFYDAVTAAEVVKIIKA